MHFLLHLKYWKACWNWYSWVSTPKLQNFIPPCEWISLGGMLHFSLPPPPPPQGWFCILGRWWPYLEKGFRKDHFWGLGEGGYCRVGLRTMVLACDYFWNNCKSNLFNTEQKINSMLWCATLSWNSNRRYWGKMFKRNRCVQFYLLRNERGKAVHVRCKVNYHKCIPIFWSLACMNVIWIQCRP